MRLIPWFVTFYEYINVINHGIRCMVYDACFVKNRYISCSECKRFSRGSLDAILWLVGSQLASLAVEKKTVAPLWVALFDWSRSFRPLSLLLPVGSDLPL
jgi:hypothetical protein